MTGRELMLYILENHLEDAPIFDGNGILGFMTIDDAAAKFGVGSATIRVWINQGLLYGVRIGAVIYVPATSKDPREELDEKQNTTKDVVNS